MALQRFLLLLAHVLNSSVKWRGSSSTPNIFIFDYHKQAMRLSFSENLAAQGTRDFLTVSMLSNFFLFCLPFQFEEKLRAVNKMCYAHGILSVTHHFYVAVKKFPKLLYDADAEYALIQCFVG